MKTQSIRVLSLMSACILAVSMIRVTVWATNTEETTALVSKYEKLDTNILTNMGQEPEEISVSATSQFFDKEWYEYITYSENAVSSYRIDDNSRLVYYDPYDYTTSMIMNLVYEDEIGWSTANSVTISHEFTTSISDEFSESTESSSSIEEADGKDVIYSYVENKGTTTTAYNHTENTDDSEFSFQFGTEGCDLLPVVAIDTITEGSSITSYSGTDTVTDNTNSTTDGWTEVANRITKTTGSSSTTTSGWSQEETLSVTRTFEASYFNSDGSPLLWTIVHYEVKMPMKVVLQYKVNGQWVSVDTAYCLLTTINGSCRAWQQNTVTYYEHWGTGEPVVDTDFWSSFFSEDKLKEAYQNKLYPN